MPTINQTGFTGLDKLAQDEKIVEIWSETNGPNPQNGFRDYWATLAVGFSYEGEVHVLHESTIKDMYQALDRVVPCGDGCCCGHSKAVLWKSRTESIRKIRFEMLSERRREAAEACLAELRSSARR